MSGFDPIILKFQGRLSYHFYNEPLLHPELERFVAYTHSQLPNIKQVLYTNGDFLTNQKYEDLLKVGIAHFAVTNHGGTNIPNRHKQTVLNPESDLTLTNRGGALFELKQSLQKPCYVPCERLLIAYDGKVLLCYEDFYKKNCLGNVQTATIKTIWFSEKYFEIRKILMRGKRSAFSPCRYCNNIAHTNSQYHSLIET